MLTFEVMEFLSTAKSAVKTLPHLIRARFHSPGNKREYFLTVENQLTAYQYKVWAVRFDAQWVLCPWAWYNCAGVYQSGWLSFWSGYCEKELIQFCQSFWASVFIRNSAKVIEKGGRVSENSFFIGFDWTIVVCPKCENHVGWAFTPTHSKPGTAPTFYALIHDKLYYELEG